jgi:hypothetical protein
MAIHWNKTIDPPSQAAFTNKSECAIRNSRAECFLAGSRLLKQRYDSFTCGGLNECSRDFAPTPILPQLKCESRISERHTVAYLRALLSGVAALLLAILGPPLFISLQHDEKAMGWTGFRVFSPLCAILAIVFFTLFFAASRLHSKSLRLLLFWTPVTVISTLGVGFLALFAYAWLHVPKS